MFHFVQHAANARVVLVNNDLAHFAKPESFYGAFVLRHGCDSAPYELNFQLQLEPPLVLPSVLQTMVQLP